MKQLSSKEAAAVIAALQQSAEHMDNMDQPQSAEEYRDLIDIMEHNDLYAQPHSDK